MHISGCIILHKKNKQMNNMNESYKNGFLVSHKQPLAFYAILSLSDSHSPENDTIAHDKKLKNESIHTI